MEIDIYNSKWYDNNPMPEVKCYTICDQPSEKVNLDRTSDSSSFMKYVNSLADDVQIGNCNDIYYLDNATMGSPDALFTDGYFNVVDKLQLDCICLVPINNIENETTFDLNADEDGNVETIEYFETETDIMLNNTIFPFLSEVFFVRSDNIGAYDIFGYLNNRVYSDNDDPALVFSNWLTDSAFRATLLDCTIRMVKRKVYTSINIIETLIYST
jgi:hypothetical protein